MVSAWEPSKADELRLPEVGEAFLWLLAVCKLTIYSLTPGGVGIYDVGMTVWTQMDTLFKTRVTQGYTGL